MNSNNFFNTTQGAGSSMQKTADGVMGSAGRALDTTRDHANNAIDRAESKLRELRGNVDPAVEFLAEKAQKMARQSLDMATEAKERAEKSLKYAADATTRYVSEQPMRSMLVAVTVGVAVALLISSSRGRNRNRNRY